MFMKLRRLAYVLSSTTLSLSSLFVLMSPVAHAAVCTWTGANSSNFNDAGNWSGCGGALPSAIDTIGFDYATISGTAILNNDIVGLTVAGITFAGSPPITTQKNVVINGNDITVNGSISSDGMFYFPQINANVILGADTTVSGTMQISDLAVTDKTINLNGHNLTLQSSTGDLRINSTIAGNGNVTINSSSNVTISRQNTFTGSVQVSDSTINLSNAQGFGNASNVITVTGVSAQVNTCFAGTISNPMVFDSTNPDGALLATEVCGWIASTGPKTAADITLAGAVTLNQDTIIAGEGKVTITGDLVGAHAVTMLNGQAGSLVISSTNNGSTTSNGSYASTHKVTTVANTAGNSYAVSYNQEVVVNNGAIAGDIFMYSGLLKGTGTVGNISMSGGVVAPGMSPGILNSANLSANGGSIDAEIGGTTAGNFDQLNVTGTVNLGSSTALNVSHWNGYRPAVGDSFTIINNDGADAVTGTFQGLAEGATITVDNVVYKISYVGGTGNDVVLTVSSVTATAPVTAPNTGFNMLNAHSALSLIITLLCVAGVGLIAKKQFSDKK